LRGEAFGNRDQLGCKASGASAGMVATHEHAFLGQKRKATKAGTSPKHVEEVPRIRVPLGTGKTAGSSPTWVVS